MRPCQLVLRGPQACMKETRGRGDCFASGGLFSDRTKMIRKKLHIAGSTDCWHGGRRREPQARTGGRTLSSGWGSPEAGGAQGGRGRGKSGQSGEEGDPRISSPVGGQRSKASDK